MIGTIKSGLEKVGKDMVVSPYFTAVNTHRYVKVTITIKFHLYNLLYHNSRYCQEILYLGQLVINVSLMFVLL